MVFGFFSLFWFVSDSSVWCWKKQILRSDSNTLLVFDEMRKRGLRNFAAASGSSDFVLLVELNRVLSFFGLNLLL